MKNKIILTLAGALILSWVIFGIWAKYIIPEPIEETVTEETTSKTDTVFIKVNNYVEVKADTIYVDKKAKADNVNNDIAEYRYFPQHELLSGWVDISYTYSDTTFTIEDRQIIKQITNNVETIRTITKVQKIKPYWIRPEIIAGAYGDKTDATGRIGAGVFLFNAVRVNFGILTTGEMGIEIGYTF